MSASPSAWFAANCFASSQGKTPKGVCPPRAARAGQQTARAPLTNPRRTMLVKVEINVPDHMTNQQQRRRVIDALEDARARTMATPNLASLQMHPVFNEMLDTVGR